MTKKENKEYKGILPIDVDRKINNTSLFLLPALGLDKNTLTKMGFVNAYLGDDKHYHHYKDSIYLLLETGENYEEADELISSISIAEKYKVVDEYYVDNNHLVLVLKFPEEYLKEYKYFKQGKYSKFSKKYINSFFPFEKEVIINGKKTKQHTLFYHIFNKTQWLKDWWKNRLYDENTCDEDLVMDEWWDIPDPKKEIFRFKDIKKDNNADNK